MLLYTSRRKVLWELGETSESEYFPMPMVFCSVELGLGNPFFFSCQTAQLATFVEQINA